MSNVVQLKPFPKPEPVETVFLTPVQIINHIRRANVLGMIGTPAFAIACQALYFLASSQKKYVGMTYDQMRGRHVTYNGAVLSGPPRVRDDQELFNALQELHDFGGILSSLDKQFFNPNGNPRMHFSLSHPSRKPLEFDGLTPIYFRIIKDDPETFLSTVEEVITDTLAITSELAITQRQA